MHTAGSCRIPCGISPTEVAVSHYCAWGFSFLVSSGLSTWQGGPGRQVGCLALGERGSLEGAALLLCRASLHCCFSGCKSRIPLNQFMPSENGSGQKPVGSGNMWQKCGKSGTYGLNSQFSSLSISAGTWEEGIAASFYGSSQIHQFKATGKQASEKEWSTR